MDSASLKQINLLHPKLRDEALKAWTECQAAIADHANVKIVVDQSLRTFEQSNQLYALGRTVVNPDGKSINKPFGNKVTNAAAGQSYHNYGLAFDFKMITNGKPDWQVGPLWMKVVSIMKKYGWKWGGDFTSPVDAPHFEKTFGLNWKQLLVKHTAKQFIPGTDYVII